MTEASLQTDYIFPEAILYVCESMEGGVNTFTFANTDGLLHVYDAPTEADQDRIADAILDGLEGNADFVRVGTAFINTSHLIDVSVRTVGEEHLLLFQFQGERHFAIQHPDLPLAESHLALFHKAWSICKSMRASIEQQKSNTEKKAH